MNKSFIIFASAFIAPLITANVNAGLVDNGGGFIYDNVLDVTWSQPHTTYIPREEYWASRVIIDEVWGWRLPYISVAVGSGVTDSPVYCNVASEVECRDNELGYMFYHNLGGTYGQHIKYSGDPDLALFPTLQDIDSGAYRSSTRSPSRQWFFLTNGTQFGEKIGLPDDFVFSAWAVHDGNVSPGDPNTPSSLDGSVLVWKGAGLGYGSEIWTNMSAALDAATVKSIDVTPHFYDRSQILSYDALWIDVPPQGSNTDNLTELEMSNITAFIKTGRRVVMMGDNSLNFSGWNDQILDLVGGVSGGANSSGDLSPVIPNEITHGVSSISISSADEAIGGSSLFENNVVTLWAQDNVLTILDTNICSDDVRGQQGLSDTDYWSAADNAIFCENVANWVTSPSSVTATIDIITRKKPANVIHLKKGKFLKVVIMGDATFDALQVDPHSVKFGANEASPIRYKGKDYNHDGYSDFVLVFKIWDTGITCGDTEAYLTGQTLTNPVININGSDTFRVEPCP
jgi:hypothetical protein